MVYGNLVNSCKYEMILVVYKSSNRKCTEASLQPCVNSTV